MSSINLEHVCRICLENKANFNWNDEIFEFSGVSYKYCYYKYTQMAETDADNYPTNLCDRCASEVKNAHTLFEKAIESFIILQNSIKMKACDASYLDSGDGSQTILYQTCTFGNNFKESDNNKNPHLEISDIICYSPSHEDNMEETGSATVNIKDISTSKNPENSESSFGMQLNQQSIDNFSIKNILTPSVNIAAKTKSYNTALELNLQLEICSSKLLKPSDNKSARKTFKSFQKVSGTRGKLQGSSIIQRRCSTDKSSIIKTSRNTDSQKLSLKKNIGEETFKSFNYTSSSSSFDESDTNSDDHFSYQHQIQTQKKAVINIGEKKEKLLNERQKQSDVNNAENKEKRIHQSKKRSDFNITEKEEKRPNQQSDTNIAEKEEHFLNQKEKQSDSDIAEKADKINKPLQYSVLDQNLSEDINSAAFLNTNSNISKESQTSSVSDGDVEKQNNTIKPSEISLLKQVYGEQFDVKSLKKKSNVNRPQIREKICQYCSLKFMGTNRLMRHEATHLEHRERNYVCPKCGIKLYTKASLGEHIKVHDKNRERKHKCEFCEKAFFYKGGLNVHRRLHLGLMIKCQMCDKEFYRQIDLDRHLPLHSVSMLQDNGEKKIKKYAVQCQYCKKFVRTIDWKEHKAEHLRQPAVKCKICNKDFYSKAACACHLRKKHRKASSEYEQYIHYYVDCTARITRLLMKQQEIVLPMDD